MTMPGRLITELVETSSTVPKGRNGGVLLVVDLGVVEVDGFGGVVGLVVLLVVVVVVAVVVVVDEVVLFWVVASVVDLVVVVEVVVLPTGRMRPGGGRFGGRGRLIGNLVGNGLLWSASSLPRIGFGVVSGSTSG